MMKRTVTCGELTVENANQTVILNGWVQRRRDHGSLIFIDLRDRYGVTQVVFDPERGKRIFEEAGKLSLEDVIAVKGIVRARPGNAVNAEMPTGEIEVLAYKVEVLNESETLPFLVTDRSTGLEDLRLKYRYLDLRTRELQRAITIRHYTYQSVRKFYTEHGFFEIETPFFMKSTPEGARDFLVPSRIHKGRFYALPQSPQMYKQLLMISGFDKYFQIVRCFRDEDLRADRQPEFTQIDVEMSFVEEEDILQSTEFMLRSVFKEVIGVELENPFPVLKYEAAIKLYGSDKLDLRFGAEIHTLNHLVRQSEFKIFSSIIAGSGVVAGICIPGGASLSRKDINVFTDKIKEWGANGLSFTKVTDNGFESGIARFLSNIERDIIDEFKAESGDILFFVADDRDVTYHVLGKLRIEVAQKINLIPKNVFKPVWVTHFPLLDWSEEDDRYVATHHPFTAVVPEDTNLLDTAPDKVRSRSYDIVINGQEIGGGSIRNHTVEMQKKMFNALNINEEESERKFGFLLDALSFGAPPHGGIALGFDRLVMILAGVENIREVIAFPKTTSASSLMDGCPADVDEQQLKELGIKIQRG